MIQCPIPQNSGDWKLKPTFRYTLDNVVKLKRKKREKLAPQNNIHNSTEFQQKSELIWGWCPLVHCGMSLLHIFH